MLLMNVVEIVIRKVPKEIRDRFKALCALRDIPMQAEILRLMQDEIDANPLGPQVIDMGHVKPREVKGT